MIRACTAEDFETIYTIINDAAQAYKGAIPADRWREPYMPREELQHEIDAGVEFWGYVDDELVEDDEKLVAVMGIQDVAGTGDAEDVTLIRHAYVRTARRGQGIGGKLIEHLLAHLRAPHLRSWSARPILIGTWADATWAIRFYEKHGFRVVSHEEKERLLRIYWNIPERQVETSVVLAEQNRVVECK